MRKYKGKKICIICEGYEELDYIETLKSKAIFSNKYDFITVNAKSINTIIARYQEKYQSRHQIQSQKSILLLWIKKQIPAE